MTSLAILNLLFATSLYAAAPAPADSLCGKYLPCGSFKGAMIDGLTEQGEKVGDESIVIAAGPDANSLLVSGALENVKDGHGWKYAIVLAFDGNNFKMQLPGTGEVEGVGSCTGTICSYGFTPDFGFTTAGGFSLVGDTLVRSHANIDDKGEVTLAVSRMKKQ